MKRPWILGRKMINLKQIYKKSQDILEREVEGQGIIVPVGKDIMDLDETLLFTLNDPAQQIWLKINGKNSVLEIIEKLYTIYNVSRDELEEDILLLLEELIRKKLILEV
jgi:hypothetical protein